MASVFGLLVWLTLAAVAPGYDGGLTLRSPRGEKREFAPPASSFLPNLSEVVKPAVKVRSLEHLGVELRLEIPAGHEINRAAPGRVAIRSPLLGDALIAEAPLDESSVPLALHWGERVPTARSVDLVIEAAVYFCEESKKAVCKIRSLRIFQPLTVDPDSGVDKISVQAEVPES